MTTNGMTVFKYGRNGIIYPEIGDTLTEVDFKNVLNNAAMTMIEAPVVPLRIKVFWMCFAFSGSFVGYVRTGTTNKIPIRGTANTTTLIDLWPHFIEQVNTGETINIINLSGATVSVSSAVFYSLF